jgi:hypothetical protein
VEASQSIPKQMRWLGMVMKKGKCTVDGDLWGFIMMMMMVR